MRDIAPRARPLKGLGALGAAQRRRSSERQGWQCAWSLGKTLAASRPVELPETRVQRRRRRKHTCSIRACCRILRSRLCDALPVKRVPELTFRYEQGDTLLVVSSKHFAGRPGACDIRVRAIVVRGERLSEGRKSAGIPPSRVEIPGRVNRHVFLVGERAETRLRCFTECFPRNLASPHLPSSSGFRRRSPFTAGAAGRWSAARNGEDPDF
jgi:hypothetical protein